MGPRPFGRGRALLRTDGVEGFRFNGAAAFRPRKGPRRKGTGRQASSFNGAAAFRPRKARPRRTPPLAGKASMGPRPFGRGRGCERSLPAATLPSFNGAAAFRPRKGRDPFPSRRHGLVASMGPRPFGRGRHKTSRRGGTKFWLQWGRGLSAAEGQSPWRRCSVPKMLQWGRGLSAAEGTALDIEADIDVMLQWGRGLSAAEGRITQQGRSRVVASMGPRPFGRGRRARKA